MAFEPAGLGRRGMADGLGRFELFAAFSILKESATLLKSCCFHIA